jgi:hypothetical protein
VAKKRDKHPIGKDHRISKDDAIRFFKEEFGAEVL